MFMKSEELLVYIKLNLCILELMNPLNSGVNAYVYILFYQLIPIVTLRINQFVFQVFEIE